MKHITILNQELKGGRMKDQVGLRFQYQNINFLFHKSFFWKNFPLPDELRNAMKRLINTQYEDKEYFRQYLVRYVNPVNKNIAKLAMFINKLHKISCS